MIQHDDIPNSLLSTVPGSVERGRQDDNYSNTVARSIDPPNPKESHHKSSGHHEHGSHSHSHHASNSDHFRRLEDRMDELQQQMVATQRMIHDVAETMKRQARDPREPREARAAAVRQNFRVLSGRAMATMLAPTTAVSNVSSSFASSMDSPSTGTSRTLLAAVAGDDSPKSHDDDQPTAPHDDTFPDAHDQHSGGGGGVVVEDAPVYRKSSHVSGTRKLSVTNPVSLSGERAVTRPSMALAVAHAAAFVVEASKAASAKKVRPMAMVGPIMSRRFSISSLNLGIHTGEGGFMARATQWTRGLFRKTRVEPTKATTDEIQTARIGHERLHPLTIHHDSLQRTVWDTIVMLMIIVDVVLTPLSLSFQYYPSGIDMYNVLGNCVFALDFVVNMLSSYTTPRGVLVFGPRNTIRHYLLSVWSLPDLLSWFPFETLVSSEQGRFLGVAKVIRLVKVGQLARRFHSSKKAGIFRFIKLLGTVFIVSHCLSCYWNWVAKEWRIMEDGYLELTMGQQYAHCWSIVIGSLNASPPAMHTTQEEISVAFFMLIGNVLQATVFGSVAVLISSFDEEEVAYNKKLISTYERCRFLDIPEKLARRIQGYYENLYQETRSVSPDADAFINELSPALICEVKFQLYRDMITQIPFLSASQINPVVIEMLILHLRTVIYMQDDVLIRKGEFGDWMGFIGSKGSVGVLDPNSEARRIIRILKKGDYFGEMALLQRSKRSTTAIALSWVQIHVLCRNDLDDVKEQYPEQAEILEEEIIKYMKAKVTYK